MGALIRETRIGALSSACGRRARFANAQALLAISDFRHAESRTAGAWFQSPSPARELSSLDLLLRYRCVIAEHIVFNAYRFSFIAKR